MPDCFWDYLQSFGQSTALVVDGNVEVSYAELVCLADAFAEGLPSGRQLVALHACTSLEAIAAYIGCMHGRHPVILLGSEAIADKRIIGTFSPNLLYHRESGEWLLTHLDPVSSDKIEHYGLLARTRGWRLFVMYGQTEASPRIAYVPPDELLDNMDAIGRPVPGGEIILLDNSGREIGEPDTIGELVYRGPNVMLGYADKREDLATSRQITELRTGDLAVRKANGCFKIFGRLKRFIKLYGLRINLDDVEVFLSAQGARFYCSGTDDLLVVFSRWDGVFITHERSAQGCWWCRWRFSPHSRSGIWK